MHARANDETLLKLFIELIVVVVVVDDKEENVLNDAVV